MADDIDIEEHDVLENPLIKSIFPDLSILKKEINDYNNYDEQSSPSNTDKSSSFTTTTTVAETGVIEQSASLSGSMSNKFKNKIILGSKHSSSEQKQDLNVQIKKARICLPNITQILNNNINFCKICLILFPRQESLNRHMLLTHSPRNNQIEGKVTENKKIVTDNIKRTNYECQKCNSTFVSSSNLYRHERNIHSQSKDLKNKDDDKPKTGVNVLVKIKDSSVNLFAEKNLKECFHCDMMFTTQQLLIDHLYEVLNSKKTHVAPNQSCDEKTNEQTRQVETSIQTTKNNEQVIINKSIDTDIKDISNDKIYVCPICSYCFNVWDFYVVHMKKKHGVNKVKRTRKESYKPTCRFCNMHYSTFKSFNSHLHKRHKNKIFKRVKIQNVKKDITKTRNLMVQQQQIKEKGLGNNILKKQKNCNEESKCIKNDVKVMALKTILFKCTQCSIHFLTTKSAKAHADHIALENSKCLNCQKYFKEKDMNLHLQQHKYSNFFTVINISANKRRDTSNRILYKCPFCAVHFSEDLVFDHYAICETEPSQSTYCKICDIPIAENIEKRHSQEHDVNKLKPSDFQVVEFKNIRNKPIRRKQNSPLKMYEEMYLFNLSYCEVCKCNVARGHYKSTIHLESRCSHFIKYVCEYCGLVFSNKSINTHRKLHKKFSNLSLKDFKFHDLKNGKKILPPIPSFPKCNSCGKHFVTRFEVKRHVCFRNNHITCPICRIKLSRSAYKLHIPFHHTSPDDEHKDNEKPLTPHGANPDINLPASSIDLELKEELIAIFTCSNCEVSFNEYDEAVEHCHLHTDLDSTYPDTVECRICELSYDVSCYEKHQQLHEFPERTFQYIKFDIFNFGSSNDKWLKHLFGAIPQDVVFDILKNAIYMYETRVKMRIQLHGSDKTVYKCEKCQCFIEKQSIYEHTKTCNEYQKDVCRVCRLPITSSANDEHEECNSSLKSVRIVAFNRNEDEDVNYKIGNMRKCYVLYECRLCHSVVDKKYENHSCEGIRRECSICGLLLSELDYDAHISKHKSLASFNKNVMKVVLVGTKPNVNSTCPSDVFSKFSGIVCDYTFYKCLNCEVCVRDQRNTSQHYCLIDAAKAKCPKCDLVFDEGKLKGHLKLHDTDPDFVKETILIQTFTANKIIKKNKTCENKEETKDFKDSSNSSNDTEKSVKIYKCVCGLHYLCESTMQVHTKKCNGKVKTKQAKQNCSKCNLTFSPDVLFKHLIEHHGKKDILFRYEIINLSRKTSF